MARKMVLAALCTFAFGLSFAASAGWDYDLICLSNCQQVEIEKCQAAGGSPEQCRLINIDHCYYQCPLIYP